MLTRSALIYLSRQEGLKDFATRFSLFKKLTTRFIAGENIDEAVAAIKEKAPDLVFLDIHLHNKCGIDLLRVIRLSQWNCKVIMLTNETKKAYRLQCEQLDSSGYLDKSNDFESIPELVKVL